MMAPPADAPLPTVVGAVAAAAAVANPGKGVAMPKKSG